MSQALAPTQEPLQNETEDERLRLPAKPLQQRGCAFYFQCTNTSLYLLLRSSCSWLDEYVLRRQTSISGLRLVPEPKGVKQICGPHLVSLSLRQAPVGSPLGCRAIVSSAVSAPSTLSDLEKLRFCLQHFFGHIRETSCIFQAFSYDLHRMYGACVLCDVMCHSPPLVLSPGIIYFFDADNAAL